MEQWSSRNFPCVLVPESERWAALAITDPEPASERLQKQLSLAGSSPGRCVRPGCQQAHAVGLPHVMIRANDAGLRVSRCPGHTNTYPEHGTAVGT